jgi:hypothetical protein
MLPQWIMEVVVETVVDNKWILRWLHLLEMHHLVVEDLHLKRS